MKKLTHEERVNLNDGLLGDNNEHSVIVLQVHVNAAKKESKR